MPTLALVLVAWALSSVVLGLLLSAVFAVTERRCHRAGALNARRRGVA
jgi:hypothetical protein